MEETKTYLDEYMASFNKRKQTVARQLSNNPNTPAGWSVRDRFGITLRYWPMMDTIYRVSNASKAAQGIARNFFPYYLDTLEPKDIWQAQVMNYMNIMYTVRSNPLQSLVVFGGNGSGKSLLGSSFASTVLRYDSAVDAKTGSPDIWNPYFVNEADLLSRIEGFSRSGIDWFREYSENTKLLIIDEFGMTQWTPTDKRRVEQLLNKCFGYGVRIVILTNLSVVEFADLLSDQLKSRFKTGKSVEMQSPDYRQRYKDDSDEPDWDHYTDRDDPF